MISSRSDWTASAGIVFYFDPSYKPQPVASPEKEQVKEPPQEKLIMVKTKEQASGIMKAEVLQKPVEEVTHKIKETEKTEALSETVVPESSEGRLEVRRPERLRNLFQLL